VAQIKHLLGLTENNLRTIYDLCNRTIDTGHRIVHDKLMFLTPHSIFYDVRSPGHTGDSLIDASDLIIHTGRVTGDSIVDASNSIVHIGHPIVDSPHSITNSMRRLQVLCNRHSSFLLCQLVQLIQLERIFHVRPSDQRLPIFS
jgi:hypothetical protein